MKLSYHAKRSIACLSLKEKRTEVEMALVSDELNIDMAPDGTTCGIKLLNANAQLGVDGPSGPLVGNEAPGKSSTVKLAS